MKNIKLLLLSLISIFPISAMEVEPTPPMPIEFAAPRMLSEGCKKGDLEMVQLAIASGCVDLNSKDDNGWTPLHYATTTFNSKIVELLIKHGADCNAKTNDDRTPLHNATGTSNSKIVELLIKHGADCNAKINDGRTPLHIAVRYWTRFYFFK